MDWKEVLRRRLATPNNGPNSESGKGRPRRQPGPHPLEAGAEWEGRRRGAALSAAVNTRPRKPAEWTVVQRSGRFTHTSPRKDVRAESSQMEEEREPWSNNSGVLTAVLLSLSLPSLSI